MPTQTTSPRAVRIARWRYIHGRAYLLASQRRKRCLGLAKQYLAQAYPAFEITPESFGYLLACARNWTLTAAQDSREGLLVRKALALSDDWTGHRWAESVSSKAWRKLGCD